MADLLSDMPCRGQLKTPSSNAGVTQPLQRPSAAALCAVADGGGAGSDGSTGSRLHAIVTGHLQQQHRRACLRSAVPTTTLPPMSLLSQHELPQV